MTFVDNEQTLGHRRNPRRNTSSSVQHDDVHLPRLTRLALPGECCDVVERHSKISAESDHPLVEERQGGYNHHKADTW